MTHPLMLCPYCGGTVPIEATICPDCHEDLAGLARLEYEHAIYFNEALALAQHDQTAAAVERLGLAVQVRPDFCPAYVLLAKLHARDESWESAQAAIQTAQKLAPDDKGIAALAKEIERTAHRQAVEQLKGQEETAMQAKALAERRTVVYKRDVASAFVLGMGLASLLGLVLSWLFGGKRTAR